MKLSINWIFCTGNRSRRYGIQESAYFFMMIQYTHIKFSMGESVCIKKQKYVPDVLHLAEESLFVCIRADLSFIMLEIIYKKTTNENHSVVHPKSKCYATFYILINRFKAVLLKKVTPCNFDVAELC